MTAYTMSVAPANIVVAGKNCDMYETHSFVGHTDDGYVGGGGAAYADARSTGAFGGVGDDYVAIGQNYSGGTYNVLRGFFKFDTSGIPDTATIVQVNLVATVYADNTATDFDVQIVKQDWSADVPLDSHYDAAFDGCLSGTADDNIWRSTSGISNTTYTSGNLSTAWVSKTGYTYYSLRSSRDVANTAPSGAEVIYLVSQNYATAAYRPTLRVAYRQAHAYTMAVAVANITIAGQAINMKKALRMAVTAQNFTLAGQALTMKKALHMAVSAKNFVLAGHAVDLIYVSGGGGVTYIGTLLFNSWNGLGMGQLGR